MSLLFGGVSTDRVDCGSAAGVDNLTTISVGAWVYATSLVDNSTIFSKFRGATGEGWALTLSGVTGNVKFEMQGDTSLDYTTNSTPVAVNTWTFIGATAVFGTSGHIYTGALGATLAEATYGTSNNGATRHDDASRSVFFGNKDNATPNAVFNGRIAWGGLWSTALTLQQFKEQQYRPVMTSNLLFMHLGFNSTGTQADWSGNLNNGTVTGATVASHVPVGNIFG